VFSEGTYKRFFMPEIALAEKTYNLTVLDFLTGGYLAKTLSDDHHSDALAALVTFAIDFSRKREASLVRLIAEHFGEDREASRAAFIDERRKTEAALYVTLLLKKDVAALEALSIVLHKKG